MRLLFALPLLLAAGPAADPATALAGRYYRQFANGTVQGDKYTGQDVVEIVPVGPKAAYVRFALDFFNGHTCGIYGIAEARGDTLVYREKRAAAAGEQPCTLTIRRDGDKLSWNDKAGSCQYYCGARGTLNGDLPVASRRPIRYLPRLKASREFRDAMTEWKTGKAVNP